MGLPCRPREDFAAPETFVIPPECLKSDGLAGSHNAFAANWGFGAFVIGRIVFVFLANERRKEGRKEETRNRKEKTTRRREKKMERRGETKKKRYRKAKEDRESSRKGKNKG